MLSQILVQAFMLSGLYGLLAIGFTMIFSVGRVLNLSYGVNIMLGGYIYFVMTQVASVPKPLGFACAVLTGMAFSVVTYLLLVRQLKDNPIAVEISTLILAVAMQALIVLIFSPAPRSMWPLVAGVTQIYGISVTNNIVLATLVSWVVLAALVVLVYKTRLGREIRAVSMDPKGALISGIDPQRINLVIWALSGALGAIAGVFFATYTQLDPSMWVFPLITAVAVVIVGGIGSVIGSLVAAHIIGFMETITTTLITPELTGAFTMLLIIVVLVAAPKGLFGREEI